MCLYALLSCVLFNPETNPRAVLSIIVVVMRKLRHEGVTLFLLVIVSPTLTKKLSILSV